MSDRSWPPCRCSRVCSLRPPPAPGDGTDYCLSASSTNKRASGSCCRRSRGCGRSRRSTSSSASAARRRTPDRWRNHSMSQAGSSGIRCCPRRSSPSATAKPRPLWPRFATRAWGWSPSRPNCPGHPWSRFAPAASRTSWPTNRRGCSFHRATPQPWPPRSTVSSRFRIKARNGAGKGDVARLRPLRRRRPPGGTSRSTGRRLDSATRKRLWGVVQLAFVAAALWFVGTALARQWGDVRHSLAAVHPGWGLVLASGVLVLSSYALLIQTWRVMLESWGGRLFPYWSATRIWFVSNLGKYVPGKVWQITAMSALAQRDGISPVAATGSALVINLANILSGFVLVLGGGLRLLDTTTGGRSGTAIAVAAVLLVGLLLLPALLPRIAALAGRLTGRNLGVPRIPARPIWLATLGTAAAWLLYGLAFALLARGVLPGVRGSLADAVAVYTISYLAGYLFVPAPGGLGVREWTMVQGLTTLGLASQGDAWVIAFASRLWLTVLEVLPGVLFILFGGLRSPPVHLHVDHT